MKTLIAFLFLLPLPAVANQVTYTDDTVPWVCENINMNFSKMYLGDKCKELGQTLAHMEVTSCTEGGDDGGYTEYMVVTVTGYCE